MKLARVAGTEHVVERVTAAGVTHHHLSAPSKSSMTSRFYTVLLAYGQLWTVKKENGAFSSITVFWNDWLLPSPSAPVSAETWMPACVRVPCSLPIHIRVMNGLKVWL